MFIFQREDLENVETAVLAVLRPDPACCPGVGATNSNGTTLSMFVIGSSVHLLIYSELLLVAE